MLVSELDRLCCRHALHPICASLLQSSPTPRRLASPVSLCYRRRFPVLCLSNHPLLPTHLPLSHAGLEISSISLPRTSILSFSRRKSLSLPSSSHHHPLPPLSSLSHSLQLYLLVSLSLSISTSFRLLSRRRLENARRILELNFRSESRLASRRKSERRFRCVSRLSPPV